MKKTRRIAFLSLVLVVLMVASVLPLGMLTASAVTADANWYTSETTDTTPNVLYVNDAADLWAFATALQGGTTFAGKTVKLNADIEVNKGMDIYGGNVANAQKWPLVTYDRKFAGTFDGQGHTISGLYVTGGGEGVGIFGNVATGTTATVKNVRIENSYVSGTHNGVGGIFGEVDNETTSEVYPDSHTNATKAMVSNVYAKINVVCGGSGSANLGTGGIIGGARSDVEITNTTFAGKVTSAGRGVAAFVGAVRPFEGSDQKTYYRTHVTIKNSAADAVIVGNATETFAAALVGYTNSITTHTVENVFLNCAISGKTDAKTGDLIGGSFWTKLDNRYADTEDWQEYYFDNVHYVASRGMNQIIGLSASAQKIYGVPTPHQTYGEMVASSMGQNLTLKNNLSLNVYAFMIDPDASVTINGVEVQGEKEAPSFYRFTLNNILPQQMTDTFTVRIEQTIDDELLVIEKETSVRKYCEALWSNESTTDAEKDLVADLLRYGEAAQLRDGYNTHALATAGMDLAGYGSTVNVNEIQTKYAKTETSADYEFKSAALSMDNTLGLRLMFVAADTADLTVSVSVNGSKTQTFDANDFIRWGSAYVVDYNKIYAHQMEAPVTAKLLKNGVEVAALTYSVADYCKAFLADETQADWAVVNAMYAYGLSATAYNDSTRLVLIDGNQSDYVIVYDGGDTVAQNLALRFARRLQMKTGVLLPVVADTTPVSDKEIIVGYVDGRSASVTAYNQMTAYKKAGLNAKVVENDIIVFTPVTQVLESYLEELIDEIRMHGGDTWGIGLDYSAQIDLPVYATSGSQKVYYANENNHTLSVTGTSLAEYNAYVATLKADGFVEYTTNNVNGNLFGTYVKTENGSGMVAYTAYYPGGTGYVTGEDYLNKNGDVKRSFTYTVQTKDTNVTLGANCRITYGPLDFLPGVEEITASTTGVRAIPSIMQPARMNAYMRSSGMCYVIQLLDGSFILIDGGNADGKVTFEGNGTDKDESAYFTYENGQWVQSGDVKTSNDTEAIYHLLVEMSPDEKPVIAAWFMSHAHGDHINMSYEFMRRYYKAVDVQMFAYNFPDAVAATDIGLTSAIEKFNLYIDAYYPDAERWMVHTGQKLYLPGCEIEIFFTPEDFYGFYDEYSFGKKVVNGTLVHYEKGFRMFENGNETSIMFRITVGDKSFMVTGDSEIENCTQVGVRYQTALKSDILQTPHHGLNGPELGFYEYVDPDIVLWSIDEHRVKEDARCLGYYWSSPSGVVGGGYWYKFNGTAYKDGVYGPAFGTDGSYCANKWLQKNASEIYGVSATKPTQIFCAIPRDFVIETPTVPLW